ncbi:hypothetical protein L873DRAFT_1830152 [Choiromyces venosus 120613-1]|uniref:Uncharacterized protein n=1 Tax=Choiromyces venosus 120613-1 TaxID=1336337 RepID=A0A3N4J9E9_9PEZI|nr:hypothetical protein L873DRAFT_1830152 [Choiromyces venosus 120613-1]
MGNTQTRHAELLKEPYFVEIVDERVQLLPTAPANVYFKAQKVTNIISAMKNPEEIDNIIPFLLGMRQAKVSLNAGQKQKIIRMCNLNGRVDLVVRIIKNVVDYNFYLTKAVARECMRGALVEQTVPDKEISTKAVEHANLFMGKFVNTRLKVNAGDRLKRDPVVIGTALGVIADNNIRYNHINGEIEKLCRLLKDECWDQVEWECPEPTKHFGDMNRIMHVRMLRNIILDYTPVLEGLLGAKDILVKVNDLYPWLCEESEKLANKIAGWKEVLKDSPGLSIDVYRAAAELVRQREEKLKAGELFEEAVREGADEEVAEGEEAVDDDGLTAAQRKELEELERGM